MSVTFPFFMGQSGSANNTDESRKTAAGGLPVQTPERGSLVEVDDFWQYWKAQHKLGKGRTCEVVQIVSKDGARHGPYACKILKKGKIAMQKIFERECKILTFLHHANCIEFINGYTDNKAHYIVTNLCKGGELFHRITTTEEPYTEEDGRRISRDMLLSVKHIHDMGIIHRDLKPENFMFDTKERTSNLRLIDFGSAVEVQHGKKYKELAGTPYYMSPESVRNLDRTEFELRATDVWSIGVITYVAMSRRPPFGGPTNKDIFTKILKYKLKWPRNCKWSNELKDFLRRVIEKDTVKRMTLDEAMKHPWILGKKLDMQMVNCHHEVQDTKIFTMADRQLSRDEPLLMPSNSGSVE